MKNNNSNGRSILLNNLNQINSLNQRGGRMLSIIDLIERKTISIPLAAYLATHISNGCNILVAASPGGAGKTAVMGALLGLLPSSHQIITVEDEISVQKLEKGDKQTPITFIIHEIGRGSWYGYLWGKPVIETITHLDVSTHLFTNMHPDTLEDIYRTFEDFASSEYTRFFDFIILLRLQSTEPRHVIHEVWQSLKQDPQEMINKKYHSLIYNKSNGLLQKVFDNLTNDAIEKYQRFKESFMKMLEEGLFPIEDVALQIQKLHT